MRKILTLLALALFTSPAAFAQDTVYLGGGISSNDIDGSDNGTGWQVFVGFPLTGIQADPFKFAVEAGYMNSGDMETRVNTPFGTISADSRAEGLWATAVLAYPLSPQIDLLARVGMDFGDDDGLMAGLGLGFDINPQLQLRGEYVERDNVDSVQLNLVYFLGSRR